jgi:ATP-dependent DNA helicase RecG
MQLGDKIEIKFRLDENQKRALKKLNLFSVADLLFHFPVRYSDISEVKQIINLTPGETATIFGKVSKLKTKKAYHSKIPMGEGEIEDLSGKIKITWFHQAYLAKMIHEGDSVKLTGKVTESKYGLYLANPEFEKTPNLPIDSHNTLFFKKDKEQENSGYSFPFYHETRGITSKWFYHAIEKILKDKTLDNLEDYIPDEILKKYSLPTLKTALIWIHKPKNARDAESARKRFAFEEVFCIQLERQHDKIEYKKNKSFQIPINNKDVQEFLKRFPFSPTNSQTMSIETILSDMARTYPMSRLLEGDVGSGKTAVAATASYMAVKSKLEKFDKLQVAYMAPTEILASQHFESFIQYFKHLPINIGLITGSGCKKFPSKVDPSGWTTISRTQLLKWTASGEISILIGTHTLIQKTVKFKNLALVVIDEQHRFGTTQRRKLVRKDNIAPHLLSMTATPIPRTLALTIYGDLDLSLLEEMPLGRKPIITEIITPDKRAKTYEEIRNELENGRQLYVICPRIDEPDKDKEMAVQAKSAIAEAKRLKKEVFQKYEIGVLHSKMTKQKKEEVMKDFTDGKINILCATSVVEVGVNVPNATIIIIEGAERFGLAQLHQLRGRVIRSNHQAYCYVFADAKSDKTIQRLKALKTAKNGFELAELDLTLRGAGELGGTKQWGITDLGMEAIKNIKMVEAARTEAIRLIGEDAELSKYPLLKNKVREKVKDFHFE